jgi:alkylhydroperoxidase family enzyme
MLMSHARIPLVPENALPDLAALGTYLKGVPDSMRAYAHRPEVMKVFVQLELELMTKGLVPTPVKVRVAYITGRLNGGVYTASHTGGRLMRDFGMTREDLGRMLNEDPPTDDDALNALVRYTRLAAINKSTDKATEELLKFYSPAEIVELTCVIGLYSWTSRVHDAWGLQVEDRFEILGGHLIPFKNAPTAS